MLNEAKPGSEARRALSSLMDSDLAPDQLPQAVASWQQDAEQRATWHCYHLIGDVLRSEELARPAAHDALMLLALRARLADEPVPLAPAALAHILPDSQLHLAGEAGEAGEVGKAGRRSWSGRLVAPVALAAGFVAAAGLLVVLRAGAPQAADGGQMALNGAAPGAASQRQLVSTDAGALVRNAGLDRYLEAHRKLGNSVAAAGGAEHRVQIVYESK